MYLFSESEGQHKFKKMNLNTLKPAKGSTKNSKRIGRGTGSGRGGTSTRGHKGAGSRSGHKTKIGFEGGQMPLQRRVPKVGFKPINRTEYVGVNLDVLQTLAEKHSLTTIDFAALQAHGLASKNDLVKILGRGEVKAKLEITAHAFSATAQQAIEAAGGSIVKL
ncbi:LSU ribosomal protein L15P [Pedobacter psychrotolerans]|uniref:Large ribosomal subunit protein uL15 n=2 Tax=Pedobacter psychrotolerans TaxID=1843235 RepID=A0A4R2HI96_9SPHI|nr:LSU ribosomal protein L15P [Pedobacter psychrotolerans]GGE53319.1 50S ribosomal protein L15 [Pedobacter psychrotolerans]